MAVKGKKQIVLVYELLSDHKNVSSDQLMAIQSYEEGLKNLKNREFQRAIFSFTKSKELFGGIDAPSDLMLERARNYLDHPPPSEWDGSIIMDLK